MHPDALSQSVDHFARPGELLGQLLLQFSWLIPKAVDKGTNIFQECFTVVVLRADWYLAGCVDIKSRIAQHVAVRSRLAKIAPKMTRDLRLLVFALLDASDHRLVALELAILDAYMRALHATGGLIAGHNTACTMSQCGMG